jgi:hypothetical protein
VAWQNGGEHREGGTMATTKKKPAKLKIRLLRLPT